jgi:hypothetical protein
MFGTSLDCASCSDSISIKSYMIWNSFLRLCSVNIVELGHRANQLLIPTSSSLCRIFVHGVLTREGRIYWNFISVVYFTLRRYFFPETYCMLCRSRRWLKVVLPARRKDEEKAARGRPAASALTRRRAPPQEVALRDRLWRRPASSTRWRVTVSCCERAAECAMSASLLPRCSHVLVRFASPSSFRLLSVTSLTHFFWL